LRNKKKKQLVGGRQCFLHRSEGGDECGIFSTKKKVDQVETHIGSGRKMPRGPQGKGSPELRSDWGTNERQFRKRQNIGSRPSGVHHTCPNQEA